MRLTICAIGRIKAGPERELAARYASRIMAGGRGLGLSGPDIREFDESRARRAEDRRAEEGRSIAAALPEGVPFICLDERGRALTSEDFAASLQRFRDNGSALAFVIGGPDGIDEDVLSRSAVKISFGAMTFPHQLVRVLLLEQLYRATTILAGHPYHRGAGHRD